MAQGAVASLPQNGTTILTAEDLHEILECEKIMHFRDAVLAGTHPRIKVPHLNGKNATRGASTPTSVTPRPTLPPPQNETNTNSLGKNIDDNHNAYNNNRPLNAQRMPAGRSTAAMPLLAKAEINPIFLVKSDVTIKAEIQLQRLHIERALREQVEQRRLSLKASLQTLESLPDFDISDVLSKALTIVHPSTAAEAEPPVGDHTSASDSFDENTFYSSQHDSPQQSRSSQEHKQPGETPAQRATSAAVQTADSAMNEMHHELQDVVMTDASFPNNVDFTASELMHETSAVLQHQMQAIPQYKNSPGLNIASADSENRRQVDNSSKEDVTPSLGGSIQQAHGAEVNAHVGETVGTPTNSQQQDADSVALQTEATSIGKAREIDTIISDEILEPAIIRTRDDVPTHAPQPARVSPLATARIPPIIGQSMLADEATPAQVASLRKPSTGSSPDDSPKGTRSSDKKKKKKKQRKSTGKQPGTVDTPDSPYIKPEPRSPSPFGVAPLPRPLIRQRHALQQGPELNYDEPRYDRPPDEQREQLVASSFKEPRPRRGYDRRDDDRTYVPQDEESYGYRRDGRDKKQYPIVSQDIYHAPASPILQALQYSTHEPRSVRAASRAVSERHILEGPRYYRDLPPRARVRLEADRERSRSPIMRERRSPLLMAPPRVPPSRIVVDEYGRQYYTPAPVPVSSRHSVAPPSRPGDENFIYERASIRPAARPMTDLYEEDGIVYRRSPPPLTTSRRVVTQPEQEIDYRSYRQRDYSSRPVALTGSSDDYMRVREPIEIRQPEYFLESPTSFAPTGYGARSRSVHPDSLRDRLPREYVTRVQSVRPEAPPKDYVAGSRPEGTGEGVPRDYASRGQSVRPEPVSQEYASGVRREAVRDVDPREYVTRVQNIRPEQVPQDYFPGIRREGVRDMIPREYITRVQSVRPEGIPQEYEVRREIVGPSISEFGARPAEPEIVRQEYSHTQDTGYTSARPGTRRLVDEAEYVGRQRVGPQDPYAEDARREVVYRQ